MYGGNGYISLSWTSPCRARTILLLAKQPNESDGGLIEGPPAIKGRPAMGVYFWPQVILPGSGWCLAYSRRTLALGVSNLERSNGTGSTDEATSSMSVPVVALSVDDNQLLERYPELRYCIPWTSTQCCR